MMENKHTPAPWKILNLHPKKHSVISIGKTENIGSFCEIYTTGSGNTSVQKANARLIAAAPELLSELINSRELIVDQCGIEADCELVMAIDSAIEKAKGET